MKELSNQFLNTLFMPGEEVCFAPNKYAYKSQPWENLGPEMVLEAQGEKVKEEYRYKHVSEDDIISVSINPIKGEKNDKNVTSLRTFLVELDDGDVYDQKQYIDSLKMPYSVCVFSGNKSLHYGITLNIDLPSDIIWYDINKWILNIVKRADQQNVSPTKSIRFPGNKRKDGKGLVQALIDIKGRVDYWNLVEWLNKYPELNPMYEREAIERERKIKKIQMEDIEDVLVLVPPIILDFLYNDELRYRFGGRNNGWYWASMRMAEAGFDEDFIEDFFRPYFYPESDFSESEWKSIIKSAVRKAR